MFDYRMYQLREADLIRAAEHHRLVREAREARRAERRSTPKGPTGQAGRGRRSYTRAA